MCPVESFWLFNYRNVRIDQFVFASNFSIIIQLSTAVNIIIVHPWDVVFPRAKALGKTTPLVCVEFSSNWYVLFHWCVFGGFRYCSLIYVVQLYSKYFKWYGEKCFNCFDILLTKFLSYLSCCHLSWGVASLLRIPINVRYYKNESAKYLPTSTIWR